MMNPEEKKKPLLEKTKNKSKPNSPSPVQPEQLQPKNFYHDDQIERLSALSSMKLKDVHDKIPQKRWMRNILCAGWMVTCFPCFAYYIKTIEQDDDLPVISITREHQKQQIRDEEARSENVYPGIRWRTLDMVRGIAMWWTLMALLTPPGAVTMPLFKYSTTNTITISDIMLVMLFLIMGIGIGIQMEWMRLKKKDGHWIKEEWDPLFWFVDRFHDKMNSMLGDEEDVVSWDWSDNGWGKEESNMESRDSPRKLTLPSKPEISTGPSKSKALISGSDEISIGSEEDLAAMVNNRREHKRQQEEQFYGTLIRQTDLPDELRLETSEPSASVSPHEDEEDDLNDETTTKKKSLWETLTGSRFKVARAYALLRFEGRILLKAAIIYLFGAWVNLLKSVYQLSHYRVFGLSQRMAIAYASVSQLEFFCHFISIQAILVSIDFINYCLFTAFIPQWLSSYCYSTPCYASHIIDRILLDSKHLEYEDYDSDGLFITYGTLFPVVIGLWCYKICSMTTMRFSGGKFCSTKYIKNHTTSLITLHWFFGSIVFMLFGLFLYYIAYPIHSITFSPSYLCIATGIALSILSTLIYANDIQEYAFCFFLYPFVLIGSNPAFSFVIPILLHAILSSIPIGKVCLSTFLIQVLFYSWLPDSILWLGTFAYCALLTLVTAPVLILLFRGRFFIKL